jgi:predicted transposase YbfD/YdcC
MDVDFPHARCALRVHHTGTRAGKSFDETCYYISNRTDDTHSLEEWLQHVRNHWAGVENRLHWRKDACLREDHTRSRNANLVGALALMRNALFAIHQPHHENYGGLNGFTEAVAADSFFAYRLITRPL